MNRALHTVLARLQRSQARHLAIVDALRGELCWALKSVSFCSHASSIRASLEGVSRAKGCSEMQCELEGPFSGPFFGPSRGRRLC